jgi:hypothetical protein
MSFLVSPGLCSLRWVSPLGLQVAGEEAAGSAGWRRGSSLRRCLCRDRSYGRYPCSGRSCHSGVWGHGRYPYGCPRQTKTTKNYRAQWQRPRGRLSAVRIQRRYSNQAIQLHGETSRLTRVELEGEYQEVRGTAVTLLGDAICSVLTTERQS